MDTETQTNFAGLKEINRIEAFSDGVFAIAITLLILNIRIPNAADQKGPLWNELLKQWPEFVSLLIGFFTILVCWLNHHHVCNFIAHTDNKLLIYNSLILLVVILVPISTSILAKYIGEEDQQTAIYIYVVTYILMAAAFNLMWRHAFKKKLTKKDADPALLRSIKKIYDIGVLYTTATMIVSLWSIYIAMVLYTVMFIVYSSPEYFARKLAAFNKE